MTILIGVVEPVCIAEAAHLDIAALVVAPEGSGCRRGGEHRWNPAVRDSPLQQRFPIERFEDLERWIVERSAKVRRQMAAQGDVERARARARG